MSPSAAAVLTAVFPDKRAAIALAMRSIEALASRSATADAI